MNEIELSYGGDSLALTKSESIIGIRPYKISGLGGYPHLPSFPDFSRPQLLGNFFLADTKLNKEETDSALNKLRKSSSVSVGTHVYHTSDDGVPFVPTGKLFIQFEKQSSRNDRQEIIELYQLMTLKIIDEHHIMVEITRGSPNPVKLACKLQNNCKIESAEPELATPGRLESSFKLPSDDLLSKQWHLKNHGSEYTIQLKKDADARVIDAWQTMKSLGSSQISVALIDDGFDLDHPDLSRNDKIVAPWDFQRNNADPSPATPQGAGIEMEKDWHGTACAGIAIGNAHDGGIVGVAPDCRFMPIRWGNEITESQLIRWFDHARKNGASVISCSWKAQAKIYNLGEVAKKFISDCATKGRDNKGIVICFAAGNDSSNINDHGSYINGFALHPNIITVSACTSRDTRSFTSNYGREVSICAPGGGGGGEGIWTTDVGDHNMGYDPFSDYVGSFQGTSSAAPVVAGVCALILSANPSLTASQVKEILELTARDIGKMGKNKETRKNNHSPYFGYGCVDANKAVQMAIEKKDSNA